MPHNSRFAEIEGFDVADGTKIDKNSHFENTGTRNEIKAHAERTKSAPTARTRQNKIADTDNVRY